MDYKAEWRLRTRAWALALLGGKCIACGLTERLQFDHVDASTKVIEIGVAIRNGWSRERLLEELAKCQLLCRPHHLAKSRREGDLKGGQNRIANPSHGTAAMYGSPNQCRCDSCRKWKREYRAGQVDSFGRPCAAMV